MKAFKYLIHLLFATIVPMFLTVAAIFVSATVTDLLGKFVSGSSYQRLGSTPPFIIQTAIALVLGLLLINRIGERKAARWVWVIPAAWMIVGIVTWSRIVSLPNISVWQWFFTGDWWDLPASPLRSRWVIDQFTHTAPLFTATAYTVGGLLRPEKLSKNGASDWVSHNRCRKIPLSLITFPATRRRILQNSKNEPRLVNPVARGVWREVYNGRWADLRRVQKAEFVIEVVFGLVLCGWLLYFGFVGSVTGTLLVWGAVLIVLLSFFFVLTRFIR
ncbi:MAG TPA: hypothetical protein VN577_12395 [Terriglobales bacterium]|nr:hypothetical protein [Terriglobales bacterium]